MAESKRDLVGYGNKRLHFSWPGGRRLALSIVINYEEGTEHSAATDGMVEGVGEFLPVDLPIRDVTNESAYEYGPRVGVWRILSTLKKYEVRATFFAIAETLEANKAAADAIVKAGHEVCDHGLRWTENYRMTYEQEKDSIIRSAELIEKLTGRRPAGYYAREPSVNTLKIVSELGSFLYDSDAYNDDVPYRPFPGGVLVLPYTPDVNDFHFLSPMHRFSNSSDFFVYMKDSFDVLREEAKTSSKMMSVGLHTRISGRAGRIVALRKFLEYVKGFDDVWVATREEIARYWVETVEPTI